MSKNKTRTENKIMPGNVINYLKNQDYISNVHSYLPGKKFDCTLAEINEHNKEINGNPHPMIKLKGTIGLISEDLQGKGCMVYKVTKVSAKDLKLDEYRKINDILIFTDTSHSFETDDKISCIGKIYEYVDKTSHRATSFHPLYFCEIIRNRDMEREL